MIFFACSSVIATLILSSFLLCPPQPYATEDYSPTTTSRRVPYLLRKAKNVTYTLHFPQRKQWEKIWNFNSKNFLWEFLCSLGSTFEPRWEAKSDLVASSRRKTSYWLHLILCVELHYDSTNSWTKNATLGKTHEARRSACCSSSCRQKTNCTQYFKGFAHACRIMGKATAYKAWSFYGP